MTLIFSSLSVIASTGSRHRMKKIFIMELLCNFAKKKRFFCQNFRYVFVISSSVARMRVRERRLQRWRERSTKKRERETNISMTNQELTKSWEEEPSEGLAPVPQSFAQRIQHRVPYVSLDVGSHVFIKAISWAAVVVAYFQCFSYPHVVAKLSFVFFPACYGWWWSCLGRSCVGSVGNAVWCRSVAIFPLLLHLHVLSI